ncbi:MAG: protein-glutamate O-methyltransferase CheR [Nitrospirae bacterium]|nr:protein-glutamate O-methyltransferase CheR [Nitrospirota bacterium]
MMNAGSKNDFMSEDEYRLLRELVHQEFGILLQGDKRLTLHTKVSHRLSILDLATYRDYYDYIVSDRSREELFTFASHITNNETYFFREKAQLDVFSDLLKEIKKERQMKGEKALRVLSLASSSGEEAYSLNIIIQESGHFMWDWDIRVTGMDIDRRALGKAVQACYTRNSFRTLNNGDKAFIKKYFTIDGDRYCLRKAFARNVEFRHGNILDAESFSGLGGTDIILCRNALIYMSNDAIGKIVRNFYDCLSDSGYLLVGSSESLIQKTNLFTPEYCNGVIVYRKNIDHQNL